MTSVTDRVMQAMGRALGLGAAPVFALMAWQSAGEMSQLCLSAPMPMGGMTGMYLLMSLFHLPPWLGLVRHLGGRGRTFQLRGE